MLLPRSQAFEQSRPVLLTTFINKACSIGLSLIPILLVRRGVSTGQGAFVLSTLKATILAGTLGGGWLSDRLRARTLMRLTPAEKNAGFYYALGLTLMQCGRIAGAALAFPLLIHAEALRPFYFLIGTSLTLLLLLLFALRGAFARLG